uniref:Uncharacterized protein n=1 Tax=Parascaris equorum TaxID=6256 RepID=A0A914RJ29_PAREQ
MSTRRYCRQSQDPFMSTQISCGISVWYRLGRRSTPACSRCMKQRSVYISRSGLCLMRYFMIPIKASLHLFLLFFSGGQNLNVYSPEERSESLLDC